MSRHIFFWHLSELAESIVWRLTLTWGNSVIVSNVSPVPFFLLLVFPLHTLQPFVHSPWIFCSVFSSFCSLCFPVLEVSINISLSSEILSLAMSSLLISL